MPGCIVSAITASFRSVEKRRRLATPVITSTFENVSDIGVCPGICLGVWSQALMVHYFLRHGGMHFGPGSSRQRHHDRGGPSSDTAARAPENSGQTTRDQSEDRGQMEKAQLCRGSSDWP